MKLDKTLNSLRDKITPSGDDKLGKILKVAAGTAAAVWVVLQLRRELYGPGGSKMSPYDSEVDDVWDEEEEKQRNKRKSSPKTPSSKTKP